MANFDYTINYVAQVLPVEVDGKTVQANDILISGNTAFVAYNDAGENFLGAIQIIDITHRSRPQIVDEIKFLEMDINALYIDGNTLYFGGAANPDIWTSRTFIGKIELNRINVSNIMESLVFLEESYAVTAITKSGNDFYIGVGARDGGIIVLDRNLNKTNFIERPDIRDIGSYGQGVIALAGTTDSDDHNNGEILIIKRGEIERIPIDDFDSPYAKSTFDIYRDDLVFLGLSEAGFKVLDLNATTPEIFFEAPNPTDSDEHTTNSVSYDNNFIFSANGEYGFRVFRVDMSNRTDNNFANIVGYHSLDGETYSNQNYSANHIISRANFLFVASGVGGVNIYTLDKK